MDLRQDITTESRKDESSAMLLNEANAVASFLEVVNNLYRSQGNSNPITEQTASKFLSARKFDVQRALELYQMHEITRLNEGLTTIDPDDVNLKAELESQKFTILKHRDPDSPTIAIFTAKLHAPNKMLKNSALKRKTHRNTLQGIVFQLDSALEDIVTQKNGIVFIYNMSDSDFSNFDLELCQKILDLLKDAYPAKLKKVLIVSPPLWFRAPFHLLRLIVKEKLRDRMWLLDVHQLLEHIPSYALTHELGGTYHHDHQAWIDECNNLYKARFNDLCLSLKQFIDNIKTKGRAGLGDEYESIVKNEKLGTFMASSTPTNMKKNRYINIKCYDHSRVILEPYDLPKGTSCEDSMDYINASFVDGHQQPKAYISTQGPIERTFMDFWRMMWQTNSRVIVMVTLNIENEMLKCDRYWPSSDSLVMITGLYKIEYITQEMHNDFIVTHLELTNTRAEVKRDIWHLQFISWPDFGTPLTATALLEYREHVLRRQLDAINSTGDSTYPPIVVHCSAGVGRSGTFITIDTCIQQLETTGLVDVKSVVVKLREQRYYSIQTKEQYIFCHKSILEYAVSRGLISTEDTEGLLL